MKWIDVLIDGFIVGSIFNLGVFFLMEQYPHFILSMLPKKIKGENSVELDKNQASIAIKIYIFILVILFTYSITSGIRIYKDTNVGFWTLFFHAWIVTFIVNIGDAILLDLAYLNRRKEKLSKILDIPSEHFESKYIFKNLTKYEHGLLWPLVYQPIMSMIYTVTLKLLI